MGPRVARAIACSVALAACRAPATEPDPHTSGAPSSITSSSHASATVSVASGVASSASAGGAGGAGGGTTQVADGGHGGAGGDPAAPPPQSNGESMAIYVVDVGQGDATLVVGPALGARPKALLIDAGDRHPDGGAIIGDLLDQIGVTTLDYVVLSHFDGDHIGGFVTVSSSTALLWHTDACDPTAWFPVEAIFDQGTDTNVTQSSSQWNTCVPAIATARGTPRRAVVGGDEIGTTLDLGGGYTATIVAGDGYVIDSPDRVAYVNTPNERSIAVLVSGSDGFDFLVTGDLIGRSAGSENAKVEGALGEALEARGVDVEVLRTGHHGAANASDPGFIANIRPEVAIISTGDDQPSNYLHPRCDHYASLTSVPLVLQTELGNSDCADTPPVAPVIVNGTIAIEVTGASYTVSTHGTHSPANGAPSLATQQHCTVIDGCPRASQP